MNAVKIRAGIVSLVLFLLLAACAGRPAFHGEPVEPPAPAPEIALADQHGQLFRLSGMAGKVVLIFFGFTNCPHECPLTAANLRQALALLGGRAGDVQVVMVSTDPLRDTPQAVAEFLARFDPAFIGIPGTTETLGPVWDDYGVVVLQAGETHSSSIYAVDRAGDLRLTFTPEAPPQEIAADLALLLDEQP